MFCGEPGSFLKRRPGELGLFLCHDLELHRALNHFVQVKGKDFAICGRDVEGEVEASKQIKTKTT